MNYLVFYKFKRIIFFVFEKLIKNDDYLAYAFSNKAPHISLGCSLFEQKTKFLLCQYGSMSSTQTSIHSPYL